MTVKQIRLSELLPKAFHSSWKAAIDSDILNVVEKGGRGSGKSSDIAIIVTQLLMRYPLNAVGIRKIDNTLELSIFEQMKWAIELSGISHLFKVNKSPMKITYKPRGNYMVFRGAQEPERIKSLKASNFPFAFVWIEELAEFKTEDEITTITNSILRGELEDGLFYKFFFSYNPPKRKQSWVNKKYESEYMSFTHPVPDWNAQGATPPESLRANGWQINQRPPADYFNWFFYNSAKAIIELQLEAINVDQKGVPSGVATLGADGKVPASQLNVSAPPDASTTTKGVVQLSNSTTSTSEVLAATPKAGKDAKDGLVTQIGTLADKANELEILYWMGAV